MTQKSIDELLQLAKEDLARNSLTSAERILEQAILINNQLPESFFLLGNVYTKRGKFKKALSAFERVLTLDPHHTEAAISLSSLYNDLGRYQEGASHFHRAKKRLEQVAPGQDPRINQQLSLRHSELAALYLKYERFQEAFIEYEKASSLQPEAVVHVVQMAKCLNKVGERARAIEYLREVLSTKPKAVDAHVQLGILYHAEKRIFDAYKEWQEALNLDPDNRNAQMYLSMIESVPTA